MHLIDTNVAIHMRDSDQTILNLVDQLQSRPVLSILSVVELEGGVVANPHWAGQRRIRLDALLASLDTIAFGQAEAIAYRGILRARGFARSRVIDRMIAATAIAHGLTLITINGDDFRDIAGLSLEIWPTPAQ